MTSTVTKTTTTTVAAASVTAQLPIGEFYLEAENSDNGADGLYAQILGGGVYYRYGSGPSTKSIKPWIADFSDS